MVELAYTPESHSGELAVNPASCSVAGSSPAVSTLSVRSGSLNMNDHEAPKNLPCP